MGAQYIHGRLPGTVELRGRSVPEVGRREIDQ